MSHTYEITGNNNYIVLFDDAGNEYPITEDIPGLCIAVHGNNVRLRIHRDTVFQSSGIAIVNDDADVEIARSSLLCITVGISYGCGQILRIGTETRIGGAHFDMSENSQIYIGQDCLMSDNIRFQGADGHTIFDTQTGEIINAPRPIVIGNHCWIGRGTRILKGAGLANNSILGMESILTRRINTPHVAVAGMPARIVRQNVDWTGQQILTMQSRGARIKHPGPQGASETVLAFACSNYYLPYLGVALTSLVSNISPRTNYKIYIMDSGISPANRNRLAKIVAPYPNITMEFTDLSDMARMPGLQTNGHLSVETFFKLQIPRIYSGHSRVLFCDSDILFLDDPAKLYSIDMCDKKLGAGLCHLWNGVANTRPDYIKYAREKLGIDNPDNYFQAGILLFNNRKITDDDVTALLQIATADKYTHMDQDVLNMYFKNDVFLFDSSWNYEVPQQCFQETNGHMSPQHAGAYSAAASAPHIVHYSGPHKPWKYINECDASRWWNIARQSDFYNELVTRRGVNIAHLVWARAHPRRVRLQCAVCRVMRHMTIGKTRKKLATRYDELKELLESE